MSLKVGDLITPRTQAGLELSTTPADGIWGKKRNVACIFVGVGVITETNKYTVDYTKWTAEYQDLGVVEDHMNCKIECSTGSGWAGEGALSPFGKSQKRLMVKDEKNKEYLTEDGQEAEKLIRDALTPIINKLIEDGVYSSEISWLVTNILLGIMMSKHLEF